MSADIIFSLMCGIFMGFFLGGLVAGLLEQVIKFQKDRFELEKEKYLFSEKLKEKDFGMPGKDRG